MPLIDVVEELIKAKPGLTECQIAETIFGRKGQQQRVNPLCRRLIAQGRVERQGHGYSPDPFTYRSAGSGKIAPM